MTGGRIEAVALDALATAADDLGDGGVELTVRGNVQVRGLAPEVVEDFARRMEVAGLAAGAEHDRVRNVTVSPLSGRIGGRADLWGVAEELDRLLRGSDAARGLSGRFWFGLDDGRGDVVGRSTDVAIIAAGADEAELLVAGRRTARLVSLADAPSAMLGVAEDFLRRAEGHWRIGSADTAVVDAVFSGAAAHGRPGSAPPVDAGAIAGSAGSPRVGWMEQTDGRVLLGAVVPFGRLTAEQARYVAAVGAPVIVTPDREILLADLSETVAETVVRVLAPLGFDFDAGSPWTRYSACTGLPGCDRSRADVRADLAAHLDAGTATASRGREHWVGCERACGSPAGPHVLRIATEDGYHSAG